MAASLNKLLHQPLYNLICKIGRERAFTEPEKPMIIKGLHKKQKFKHQNSERNSLCHVELSI